MRLLLTPLAMWIHLTIDSSIRSLSRLTIANEDQRIEIIEIGVEEAIDLG